MRNSNIYKFTVTEYMQNPPSFGGNWECGSSARTWFSRSAKRATSMEGHPVITETGVDGVPIMGRQTLTKGGKVIFDRWD